MNSHIPATQSSSKFCDYYSFAYIIMFIVYICA